MSRSFLAGALALPLALGALVGGCSSAEPAPPPPETAGEHPLERGTSEELSPPLGKPRPKLVPGDVLEKEAATPPAGAQEPEPARTE